MSKRTMRAARLSGPGAPVEIEEVPYPEPGPEEVVVRVAACGVCGSDLHFLEDMPLLTSPITLGHEPAGTIESIGAGVEGWRVGDRVALHVGAGCGSCRACASGHPMSCPSIQCPGLHIDGAFAEALRIPSASLVRVPDGVPMAAAAVATDCVATPYHALKCRGGMKGGERVAVIGVGGLGGQTMRLASVLGASQVVAVDISSAALERARRFGATDTVLAVPGQDPSPQIHEITGGGVDLAVECYGSPDTIAQSVNALGRGGTSVIVGVCMQPPRIDLPVGVFAIAEISLLGSFASHAEDLAEVLRMEAESVIDISSSITHRFPLDQVPEALEMLRTKRGDPERIVIEMKD
jgi:D-arabinose 1-dehydrogenase-like Zn-dependent alcohol dehydrogenase